ncbi:DUF6114 domain-containing protein [Streptomyces sp. URMC 124]|uniref:DUF6114 domain-containing protein n=1 Tax=Streptomyces sp. URMC 124 TaxID=3423405 RepID=UPI003F5360B1
MLLLLGGAELMAVPLAPWSVALSLGVGAIAAFAIGAALMAAGLFLWFLPHARHYVSVHAVILSVASFAASNLGGFLVGMLLGIAGGAMGFAWTPAAPEGSAGFANRAPGPVPADPAPDPAPGPGPAPAKEVPWRRRPSPPKALAAALPALLIAATAAPGERPQQEPGVAQVARTPPTVTTTRFSPAGLTIAEVTRVPTLTGPRRVMVLHMRAASLSHYRLRTADGSADLLLGAEELRLQGDVRLYLTRFSGCVQGLVCLTFSPDTLPVPPLSPPFVFITDVTAEQAFITSDFLTADGLALSAVT